MKAVPLAGVALFLAVSTSAFARVLPGVGDGIPGQAPLTIAVSENGYLNQVDQSTLTVNGQPAVIAIGSGVDGVPEYSTNGIFVGAGDINFLNPAGVTPTVSDVIRIYDSNGGTGDLFSVFSYTQLEQIGGVPIETTPDSGFDVAAIPAPNRLLSGALAPFVNAGVEYPVVPYVTPFGADVYTFKSDSDVPEPASLALLASTFVLGSVRRRRH